MNKSLELKRLSAMIVVVALLLGPGFTSPTIAAPNSPITITVDTTTDNAALQACTSSLNDCSLRGAISKANADASNTYTIVLPANTYTLTLAGSGEDNNATGDLDILTNLTISGANPNTTLIDANKIDRVLHIIGATTSVWIQNVKITKGRAPDGTIGWPVGSQGSTGGGIQNAGILKLEYCIVADNRAGDGGAGLPAIVNFAGGGGGSGGDGGGIYTTNSLTLMETIIRNNRSGDGGVGGSGSFNPVTGQGLAGGIGGNGGSGGGVDNSGNLSVIRSIFFLNTTGNGGSGGTGGSLFMPGAPAGPGGAGGNGGVGGGIFNMATLTMNDSAIDDNQTGNGGTGGTGGTSAAGIFGLAGPGGPGGSGGSGGGIYNSSATATLDNITISNNTAGNGSAGGTGGDGTGVPPFPAFPGGNGGNGGNGGGTYNSGTLNLYNLTISGNSTGSGGVGGTGGDDFAPGLPGGPGGNGGNGGGGGGIYNTGTITTNNTTIVNNSTSGGGNGGTSGVPGLSPAGAAGTGGNGGGVLIYAASVVTVMNTILGDNSATSGPDCNGNLTSQDYNLIENVTNCTIAGSIGGNITGQDPQLEALADNGGSTQTHALKLSSPAIDSANPAPPGSGGSACMGLDQRSILRPIDGDLDGTATCDIGSYERQILFLYLPLLKK